MISFEQTEQKTPTTCPLKQASWLEVGGQGYFFWWRREDKGNWGKSSFSSYTPPILLFIPKFGIYNNHCDMSSVVNNFGPFSSSPIPPWCLYRLICRRLKWLFCGLLGRRYKGNQFGTFSKIVHVSNMIQQKKKVISKFSGVTDFDLKIQQRV